MNENITSNNIEDEEDLIKNKENDYKNLISRLKEIKTTIAILEKTIL